MHFGTGPVNMDAVVDLDPYILDEHLEEIEICSKVSKSIFFIVSIFFIFFIFSNFVHYYIGFIEYQDNDKLGILFSDTFCYYYVV